jgi:c-di-GMP-binding flagellar brake protein YcgR
MPIFQVSLGERIELRPQLSDGSFASVPFPSQIQDIVSAKEFLIFPLNDEDLDSWLGRVLQLTVIRKNETYVGTVKVEKKSRERRLFFLHLVLQGNFRRLQRRAFYRLKIELATEIFGYGKFRTVDISGGGMAFIADRKIAERETIAGSLDLKGNLVRVAGTVVRCVADLEGKYLICLEFQDISKPLQDEIVRFIHKQQIMMIKKGVL